MGYLEVNLYLPCSKNGDIDHHVTLAGHHSMQRGYFRVSLLNSYVSSLFILRRYCLYFLFTDLSALIWYRVPLLQGANVRWLKQNTKEYEDGILTNSDFKKQYFKHLSNVPVIKIKTFCPCLFDPCHCTIFSKHYELVVSTIQADTCCFLTFYVLYNLSSHVYITFSICTFVLVWKCYAFTVFIKHLMLVGGKWKTWR